MKWIVKEINSYNLVVWKNGKGKSTQIHVEPQGMSVQDPFEWRVSSAVIQQVGPFSAFEGYTRTLILLKGTKIALFHQQQPNICVQLNYFRPYTFNGGWDTDSIFQSQCPAATSGIPFNSSFSSLSVSPSMSQGSFTNSFTPSQTPTMLSPAGLHSQQTPVISSFAQTESASNFNNIEDDGVNSPVIPHHPRIPIIVQPHPKDEAHDFNVFTRDSVCDHSCVVYEFGEQTLNPIPQQPSAIKTSHRISMMPSGPYKSSSMVFYSFGGDVKIHYEGMEGTYIECKLLNGHSLIIQDITPFTNIDNLVTVESKSPPNHQHHLIVVNINYLDNPKVQQPII
ncbi:hypothetical protein DFA_08485 [Cavenderia fasciculata]|uniref:Uncharacterized protein n=1 Tax=Cavenderia fasciculata TaxID=261658 RepID=F4Q2M2_CACFS|nr:uncharacterized protein DFA_08485 [Cavenderia fasciculata]EGG17489.1 hypothetical protein DFA_08485 [Cavenderia fasciculata]|eukprot:XP_004355973.1 hypothetical protein DFA_08485 [Cavenderia fasciculata]